MGIRTWFLAAYKAGEWIVNNRAVPKTFATINKKLNSTQSFNNFLIGIDLAPRLSMINKNNLYKESFLDTKYLKVEKSKNWFKGARISKGSLKYKQSNLASKEHEKYGWNNF